MLGRAYREVAADGGQEVRLRGVARDACHPEPLYLAHHGRGTVATGRWVWRFASRFVADLSPIAVRLPLSSARSMTGATDLALNSIELPAVFCSAITRQSITATGLRCGGGRRSARRCARDEVAHVGGWPVGARQPVSALYPDAVGARCSPGLVLWENSALCSAPSSVTSARRFALPFMRARSLSQISLSLLTLRCSLLAVLCLLLCTALHCARSTLRNTL
eukprot:COSAG06_NODE_2444_length_6866_cov_141.297769_3_plen_221_part_00